jgi:CheY-like chemotaxis protein
VPHKPHVLIVEDHDDSRMILQEILESEGIFVEPATNGLEALGVLRRLPRPDLVFLDMMMPIMDGAELLEVMSSDPDLAAIPVVVVSASASRIPPGAAGFLLKPVDPRVFLETVERFCGPRRGATA